MYDLYAFDFDGTLTKRDSLIEFIRYAKGTFAMIAGFVRYCPMLIMMKLHAYSNGKAKQKIFAHFFRSMPIDEFNETCRRFAHDQRGIIREGGLLKLYQVLNSNEAHVLIVSASVDNWVRPFFEMSERPENTDFRVVGMQVEVVDGRLTGRFLTPNCYGEEKVRRIRKLFPNRSEYRLFAYGDSRGDRELLRWADEAHYQPFRENYNRAAFDQLLKSHFFLLFNANEVD